MLKIWTIIVTFNGEKWIGKCLNSLLNSSVHTNITVIDNMSSDRTLPIIKGSYPEVYLIENQKNWGFGKANNTGIRLALQHDADFVFLINQDAWIEPDVIKHLMEISISHPEYGILAPLQFNPEKKNFDLRFQNYVKDCPGFISDLYFKKLKDVYPANFVNACGWLVTRNTLERIGGFDPLFFHYYEDDDYVHRVIYHGLKIGICTGVSFCHARDIYTVRSKSKIDIIKKEVFNNYIKILLALKNLTRSACDLYSHWTKELVFMIANKIIRRDLEGAVIDFFTLLSIFYNMKKIICSRNKSRGIGRTYL